MSSWLGGGGGSSASAAGGGGGGSAAKTYKLLCISILRWCPPGDAEEPVLLDAAYNLSEYSFFTRGGVQEFMAFACRTVMKRLTAGTNAIDYEGNHLYCVVQSDGLGIIVMTDKNYPGRVAVKLARDMLEAFKAAHGCVWAAGCHQPPLALAGLGATCACPPSPSVVRPSPQPLPFPPS